MQSVFREVANGLLVLAFVYSISFLILEDDRHLVDLLTVIVFAGGCSAAISLYEYYVVNDYQYYSRLSGYGRLKNPVIAGISYGVVPVLALGSILFSSIFRFSKSPDLRCWICRVVCVGSHRQQGGNHRFWYRSRFGSFFVPGTQKQGIDRYSTGAFCIAAGGCGRDEYFF